MNAKELLTLIDLLATTASIAIPGSHAALMAVRGIHQLTQIIAALLDGRLSEEDLHLPGYQETLAQARAAVKID